MFEKEIKFIFDFTTNKTKSLGNFNTFTELSKIGMHPAILKFISADIDYLIFEDRQSLLKNSAFDYSGEKINKYFSLINDEIKKSKKLSADYINKLILHAITFNVNYLIRPRWALEKFVFEDSPSKSVLEINQILNYLFFYPHIKKIIISYLTKKKLLSINQSDFNELLKNIDKITIESSLPTVINTALISIVDFMSIGSVAKDTIHLNGLKVFLNEKELNRQVNTLINHFGNDDKQRIKVKEAASLLLNIDSSEEIFEEKEIIKEEILEEFSNEDVPEKEETEFEISEKEESFLENFEEKPIKNVEEIDELTDDEIANNSDDEEELEDEGLLLHHKFHDENPITLLPDEHFEDDTNHEIKENGNQNYTDEDFHESEFDSEDPSDIIDDEDYFKDLEHYHLLTEESEKEEVIDEDESNDNEEEKLESTKFMKIENLDETEDEEDSIFEIKDSALLDDIFTTAVDENEEEIIEPKQTESDKDDFLDNQIDDEELLDEFPDEEDFNEKDSTEVSTDELLNDEDPLLFSEEELSDKETIDLDNEIKTDNIIEEEYEYDNTRTSEEQASGKRMIEMSDLLENKNMTKIIEVVFDYDMEDFANTIEKISECSNKDAALLILNKMLETNRVNPQIKEAEILKEIISKYFDEH
ncbi:MAG: hypothetical protein CMF23_11255 [Ignavibacteriae bacterium]|nr:hypothetical protein [Ignavibacteriota bacterium]